MTRTFPALFAGVALGLAAPAAQALDHFADGVSIGDADTGIADLFVNDVTVLDGKVCVGDGCVQTETFQVIDTMKLMYFNNSVLFDDTTTDTGFPDRDWRLRVNDSTLISSGGLERFSVEDVSAGRIPFTIEGNAPDNALWIKADGKVGLGTSLPQGPLHIAAGGYPTIYLEDKGMAVGGPHTWRMVASEYAFGIIDVTAGNTMSFLIGPAAPDRMMRIEGTGVGIGGGFFAPDATLHVRRDDGTAQLHLQEADATTAPRTLLNIQNNGRPEIVMANTATGGEWSFGAGTNFVLKQGAVGSDSSVKTKLFEVGPTGDATLAGTLITGGTTCGGGCDRVFSEDYDLPSISDHAAQMFALGHLPNVGPTLEGTPIDVTDKLGRMLNELEHAHIYIARQQAEIADLKAAHATRISALEARIAELARAIE